MVRTNFLKNSLLKASKPLQLGLWTGLRSSTISEILSHPSSGFDWFVIDMEHSPNEISDVLHQLQSSQHGKVEPVVRVPWNDAVIVKRILDIGAQSVLFPMINNAKEARQAVASTRYPPHGVRGVMSLQRMNEYGALGPQYYHEAAAQLLCICQIETIEGIKNIEEIAEVDGVDALFIGPSDLSASLGQLGNPKAPVVRETISNSFRRILSTGKSAGFLSSDKNDCTWAIEHGCNLVAVGSDIGVFVNSSKELSSFYRKQFPKKEE